MSSLLRTSSARKEPGGKKSSSSYPLPHYRFSRGNRRWTCRRWSCVRFDGLAPPTTLRTPPARATKNKKILNQFLYSREMLFSVLFGRSLDPRLRLGLRSCVMWSASFAQLSFRSSTDGTARRHSPLTLLPAGFEGGASRTDFGSSATISHTNIAILFNDKRFVNICAEPPSNWAALVFRHAGFLRYIAGMRPNWPNSEVISQNVHERVTFPFLISNVLLPVTRAAFPVGGTVGQSHLNFSEYVV